MQYVDKNGNIHDLPLASVQPIVSPDSDNALYEAANGLKVDKVGGFSMRMRTVWYRLTAAVDVKPNALTSVELSILKIIELLNLNDGEHVIDNNILNFIYASTSNYFCKVAHHYAYSDKLVIGITCDNNVTNQVDEIILKYLIVKD